ncbi:type II DNA topoisomerase [Cylindrobasidium torrendii FP15055 ss-10]|uniref:DNA topoisomerase 2 n=1 Tax=Cylindrobasidium torrendii FP15055 ss-10 TaxID=1314674 RepID=A0A0D7AZU2_9AGAR|nr:type II DNA topoisomerase [Cylindrobasidium torrendii FP15055 ss-10]
MSSSEGEEFDEVVSSGSESDSDDFSAPPKKRAGKAPAAKAPAKPKAAPKSKAPAKPKAAPKKKVLAKHDDNADSDEDAIDVDADGADDAPGPSKKSGDEAPAGPAKKKTATEMYQKLTQLEHILKRPDSYIGSVEAVTQTMWTFDSETKRMVNREVTYVPGFFKIVDEILVNAADRKIVDPTMDTLKVEINAEEGSISVWNNGAGIPIEMHKKENMWVPELIFGHLLSSSNYDDNEKKLTGGRNGYGAKLTNIYSTQFTLETADRNTKQKYAQTWTDNMQKVSKAKITKNAASEYTKVTFKPDFQRFGMEGIDEDAASLLQKRVYDMCGTTKGVKVFLNGERLKINTWKAYVGLYLNPASGDDKSKPTIIVDDNCDPRWQIAFAVSEGSFQHVSFANSVSTTKGGHHVNTVADAISKSLLGSITKKNKGATVKATQIKNHMWIFVNALIENPTFDSQTKDTLTLPASKFGSKPSLSEEFLKKVQKSPIIEHILNWAQFQADKQIKKTDGKQRTRLTGLPKLSDANNAGSLKYAKDCTLILTEGDSAKALAIAGLDVVGRDNFGVFPLRGKVLNVREARHDQIMKNEEITNIRKILGLKHAHEYKDVGGLRYGKLMIMTDQDHDGSHIKGLLINFFDHFYPSLLKVPEPFLVEFVTPIVRVTKGTQIKNFFTLPEYEQWMEDTPNSHRWTAKYYKGLGTSKDSDAREYFRHMEKHVIPFAELQDQERGLIDMAFSKKKADDRKDWLRQFKPGTFLDHRLEEITYDDFINKELILFSMADNIRSIPSMADGLKPGQRKIMWSVFKRNLKKEIKVAQLTGYVSEHAAYHHGEVSLAQTIVNLAQHYVGSNNINLLAPNGQYGTRHEGGKDHASARYIFTEPTPLARGLFHPADDPLLKAQEDDGLTVEPEWYLPVVPLVLINGADGIGTGWSTSIPCFNPMEVVANIRRLMNGEETEAMHPWWRGFTGEVVNTAKNKYEVKGTVTKVDDTTIEITELPIYKWTNQFKVELDAMMEKGDLIKNYQEHHANANVHFVIQMSPKGMEQAEQQGFLEFFKLTSKVSTTNMILFDFEGKIQRYDSPEAILEEFYPMRLSYYQKRKDYLANDLQNVFEKLSNQARFVQMIVNKELTVSGRKKAAIVVDLRKHEFRPFPKAKSKAAAVVNDEDNDNDVEKEEEEEGSDTDFDYLLSMPIWNLTREKIDKLLQQAGDKEAELMTLLKLTPKDIWNTDLDRFIELWDESLILWENETKNEGKKNGKKGGKKKQGLLKTRKSIGNVRGDDSDGDFKPIKPVRKAPQSKAAGAKTLGVKRAVKDEDEDDAPKPAAATKRKASGKKPVKDESDDEDFEMKDVDPAPAPVKKAPARKAAAAKKIDIDLSDDEDAKPVKPPTKAAAKKKAPETIDIDSDYDDPPSKGSKASKASTTKRAAATKKKIVDSDSDDDIVLPDVKGKGKAKAAPKRKSPDPDGEDESDMPLPKKKKSAPAGQAAVTDFFGKSAGSSSDTKKATKVIEKMKPASPPKKKAAPASKKKVVVSDDDDSMDEIPKPPPRATTSRVAAKAKTTYVDPDSDEDDGLGDDSVFSLDD